FPTRRSSDLGAFVGPEGFEKTAFEWAPAEGADPVKFDISVKKEATVADFEFINMQDQGADDRSVMARTIHRMVRIHAVNGEKADVDQLPLADCARRKPGLLLAFFGAIGTVRNSGVKVVPKTRRKPA